MAFKIKNEPVIYDDEVLRVSANTEANRPAQPVRGMFRFNTDASTFEGYDGTDWGPIGGSTDFQGIAYYVQNIGNGSDTTINVSHNLNDENVIVAVYENSSKTKVYPDIILTNANVTTFKFNDAPTLNQYKAVIYSTSSVASFNSYVSTFGNGTTNPIQITHNLSTTNVLFAIRNNSTGYYVYPDATVVNSNIIQLEFVNVPTLNQYTFMSIGY